MAYSEIYKILSFYNKIIMPRKNNFVCDRSYLYVA
jgi:hypothetical protein